MAEASTLETLSPKELGKHLREVRRRKGLSLSEVARGAGLTRRELNAYEKGKSPIPDSDLFVLAGSCGVDVAELRVPTDRGRARSRARSRQRARSRERSSAGCLHDRRRRRPAATQPGSRAATGPGESRGDAGVPARSRARRSLLWKRPRPRGPTRSTPTKPSIGPMTRRFPRPRRPRPAAPPSRSTCSRSSPASPTRAAPGRTTRRPRHLRTHGGPRDAGRS